MDIDFCFAVRAFLLRSRSRSCRFLEHFLCAVQLFDYHEDHERHDNEVDDLCDKQTVVYGRSCCRLRLSQSRVVLSVQRDKHIAEIQLSRKKSDHRHHHVAD